MTTLSTVAAPAKNITSSVKTLASHIVIKAGAGTGKTTTIVEGLKNVMGVGKVTINPSSQQADIWSAMCEGTKPTSVTFCAFNKSIAKVLEDRVPKGCKATTLHSLGYGACAKAYGRINLNEYRTQDLICKHLNKDFNDLRTENATLLNATTELVRLCKLTLTTPDEDSLDELACWYGVDLNSSRDAIFALVPVILKQSKTVVKGNINFDDMIWLPVVNNLTMFKSDMLLVDECLPGWTPVMMSDGTSKNIDSVVVGDFVRSYNTETGVAKNCVVTNTQKLLNKKPLVKVKVRHNKRTGTSHKHNFVVCTTDHKVFTVNRGWVQAGELQIGDVTIVETAARTSQKGKLSKEGKDHLSLLQVGNKRGSGYNTTSKEQFNSIKGGNGRGITKHQELLIASLGDGWVPEYVLKTCDSPNNKSERLPNHYKIDIANPVHKIAVEIDGRSHSMSSSDRDEKKDKFLRESGWTVFRFTNRQVVRDVAEVAQRICSSGNECPTPATVVSVSETYIEDPYVYDITVEDCHNFYANGILVHNCQDLNKCQQALVRKAGYRLVFVGDINQAIYGFAGADTTSIPTIINDLEDTKRGVKVLPLTETRRCGKQIVKLANAIVPELTAHESNPEGTINNIKEDAIVSEVKDGDLVLCRVNAPLVSLVFRLIKAGIKSNIQGRDIGAGLVTFVRKFKATDTMSLLTSMWEYCDTEIERINNRKRPSEAAVIALKDKCECVEALCDGVKTVAEVEQRINDIFKDDSKGGVLLSSVHRAKGLEADNVFIVKPNKMPHPLAKTEWQVEQEHNLRYVAITRAKKTLTFAHE